ncbi:MAG TPA: sodium:solute symporter [Balneolales bacterium]|nr:sodium:solute symporter [Balneolales bacterium]
MRILHLGFINLAIVGIYFAGIIWWALKHGESKDSTSYFLAGRNMKWPAIGLSLFAASISSQTLIGQSGDAYSTGIAVFNYNLISVIVMIFFALFFLPFYINSGIYTMPEFLERRFDSRSRYYFSFITIIGNIFLDAAGSLYAAALVIKFIVPELSLQVIIIIFALAVASYTIPGGLSSAISAEIIQAAILIAGSIMLTYFAAVNGGASYIHNSLLDHSMTMRLIRPINDPSVPWLGLIVGIPILGFYFWGNNQTMVQRVLSARSVDEGRKGILFVGFLTLSTLFFIIYPGVMSKKLFPGLPDPDMVYPTMLLKLLPVGLLGVTIASLIAALTSTLSAILNSASTLITMDFYSTLKRDVTSREMVNVGRISSVIILSIAVIWAPQISKFGSLVKYYQEMLSYIAPPIVAAFFLGLFSKRANKEGAFYGLICGLIVSIITLLYKDEIFGNIHFLLVVPFIFVFSLCVMMGISLLTDKPDQEKIEKTTWSRNNFLLESKELKNVKWYRNYRFWSIVLFLSCLLILFLFR